MDNTIIISILFSYSSKISGSPWNVLWLRRIELCFKSQIYGIICNQSAIPFNWTQNSISRDQTTEQYPKWQNMAEMNVTLALNRRSQLMITMTAQLQNVGNPGGTAPENTDIYIQALVNGTSAMPSGFSTPSIEPIGAPLLYHSHYLQWGGYTFTFYSPTLLDPGTYTIQIQWCVTAGGGKAEVGNRALFVMALPA